MQTPLSASYPVLPLRDIVVFPHMIVPLFVGREKSVRALEEVMADDKRSCFRARLTPVSMTRIPMASTTPACWPMCCNC